VGIFKSKNEIGWQKRFSCFFWQRIHSPVLQRFREMKNDIDVYFGEESIARCLASTGSASAAPGYEN